jgi:hypothetical protein
MYTTYPIHLILLDLITLIIFGDMNTSWNLFDHDLQLPCIYCLYSELKKGLDIWFGRGSMKWIHNFGEETFQKVITWKAK